MARYIFVVLDQEVDPTPFNPKVTVKPRPPIQRLVLCDVGFMNFREPDAFIGRQLVFVRVQLLHHFRPGNGEIYAVLNGLIFKFVRDYTGFVRFRFI